MVNLDADNTNQITPTEYSKIVLLLSLDLITFKEGGIEKKEELSIHHKDMHKIEAFQLLI